MLIKRSKYELLFNLLNNLFMLMLMVVTLYPLWHVIMASFSESTQIMEHTGLLFWPKDFTLSAYREVFKMPMIIRGYLNTIFIVVVGCSINIVLTTLGAYFLSRKDVMWQQTCMILIVITMYFSGGLIPTYFNVKSLGLLDSLWAVILPGAVSTFNLIIMRTSFAGIPESLVESARLDGAKHIIIIMCIIVPLSMPVIAVMLLYYGVAHWNAWFNAYIYITNREYYPLQLILRELVIQGTNAENANQTLDRVLIGETIKYATIVVSTMPILMGYPFLQKYFVKGVLIGAVKG